VRRQLARELPDYMVPVHIIRLDAWPLSANGKIDRKALPKPDRGQAQQNYVAPQTPLQQQLVAIWQQLLPAGRIGINDNFFELGGHSLLAIRVLAAIAEQTGVELPVQALFESPTIAMLAETIDNSELHGQLLPAIEPVDRHQPLPLSFNQQRLWFIYQMAPEAASYNMPVALRLDGELDSAALEKAVHYLLRRHEILRTVFADEGDSAVQVIRPAIHWQLQTESFSGDIQPLVDAEAGAPFDLRNGPLFRLRLWHTGRQQHVLMLTLHHIIADAISLENLVRELALLYSAAVNNQPLALPPQAIQYADVAWWQQQVLRGEYLDKQLAYWRKQLDGAPALLKLPTDKPRPAEQDSRGAVFKADLPAALVDEARHFALQHRLTPFMLLLACQQILLGRYARQDDVCIGVPVAGRHQRGTENLLGFFVNALVMRARLDHNPSVVDFLQQVKTTVLSGFAHQDAPFEQVIEQVSQQRSAAYSPVVQIGFNYLTQAHDLAAIDGEGIHITPLESRHIDAKYDMIWAFHDVGDSIHVSIEYRSALYLPETIARLFDHFQQLLGNMLADSDAPVQKISLVDRHRLRDELQLDDSIEQVLPLTPMQRDLYLDTVIDPHNRRNYFGWIHRIEQAVDHALLQQAIDIITARFSALRMRIVPGQHDWLDIAYAAIVRADSPQSRISVQALDWSQDDLDEAAFNRRCNDELAFVPYNLAAEPIIRFFLVRESASRVAIVLTAHHSCIDGISLQTVTDAYSRVYESLANRQPLPELPQDIYPDYLQQQFYQCDNSASLDFWKHKAQGVAALSCPLPDKNRRGNDYHFLEITDTAEHFSAIKAFCAEHNSTPFIYFKALYALMLQSYCYAGDGFYFADIIAARPKGHLQQTGCYFEQRPTVIPAGLLNADAGIGDLLDYLDDYRKQVRHGGSLSNSQQLRL
ncbi:MAG TPA: condensation domain-containing protein, partial [Pseudomonadales bacterium]